MIGIRGHASTKKKEEKPLEWNKYAAWNKIPASYRERVKAKWLEEWGEGNENDIGAYVDNWLANNESKNIDQAGDIVDKQKSLVADEGNLKRLHDSLKKQGFIDGDALDYDKFREHAVNNPDYRMKLHAVIRDSGLNTDIDYNTFNKSVFGDETTLKKPGSSTLDDMSDEEKKKIADELGMTVEEMLADPTAQAMFTRAQADNTSVEIEGVPVDIAAQLQGNEEAQGSNKYQNMLIAQQAAYEEIFKGGADAIPLLPDGTVDYNALNGKIKQIH